MLLELKHIGHRYDRQEVLRDISLTCDAGEVVVLLGPSGSGKSTVLRLIAGLEPLSQGSIALHETVISDSQTLLPPEKRNIGMVFQHPSLFPHMTTAENIAFGCRESSHSDRVERMLEMMQLTDWRNAWPHTLSGGQQQRVALARALVAHPQLLLLDEAFASMDTALRSAMRQESLAYLKAHGGTAMIVTHDPEEALQIADRIYLLQDGQVAQAGSPREVYHQPESCFVATFLGKVNQFRGTVRDNAIVCPLGEFTPDTSHESTNYDVAIRPESIRASHTPLSTSGEDYRVSGCICGITFMGAKQVLDVVICPDEVESECKDMCSDAGAADARMTVQVGGDIHYQLHDRVYLLLPKDRLWFFPK